MVTSDCELDEDTTAFPVSVFESKISSGQEPGVVIFNSGTCFFLLCTLEWSPWGVGPRSESVALIRANLFLGSSFVLRDISIRFDATSLSLGVVVCREEESDLVRLALGGLAAPLSNSELDGGTDENEDRVDLLRDNAASEFPAFLDDPKD